MRTYFATRFPSDVDRLMRSDRAWLLDILDAIHDIERYRPATRAAFEDDERTQVWMVSRLQIIGEACRGLSEAFRSRHPEVPWRAVIGMRHHLVLHRS